MKQLLAQIEGIGLLGPGFDGWTSAMPLLAGRLPYVRQPTVVPVPEGLPPAERRRLGRVVKLALTVGMQAVAPTDVDVVSLPAIFASSGGDGQNCHEICEALTHEERMISPTRFHNSVHNASAGYWSIATRATAMSNVVSGFDATFAVGLLEAVTQVVVERTRVLLVAYDAPYPAPLDAKRPIPDAFGVAFVLGPTAVGRALGRLAVSFSDAPADRMRDAAFETLRASMPAARSLPLLYQLAMKQRAAVNIEYLDDRSLAVEIDPCV
jgi:hypothetical protein